MTIQSLLRELEAALEKSYPTRLAELGKPASKKGLAALEKTVGFALPEDVLALYAWRGSGEGFLTDDDTDESSEGWSWSGVDAVAADYRTWSKLKPKGWTPVWLPLFSNGAGDNVCLDVKTGRLVAMLHESPEDHPQVAASLEKALALVLRRVEAGKWRGVPESNQAKKLIAKLKKPGADVSTIFGNDLYRMLSSDPRAVLGVLAQVEALKIKPSLIFDYASRAHLALKDGAAAFASYGRYLSAVRAEGSTYNPPFAALVVGFDALKNEGWANDAREVDALHRDGLLDPWLTAMGETSKRAREKLLRELIASVDERVRGTDPEDEVRGWIELGMTSEKARQKVDALVASGSLAGVTGAALSRASAVKAAALAALGDKKAADGAWRAAAKADAKVAALWKTHVLLG